MKNHCLPCHVIVRNVCILLLSMAGTLLVVTNIHAAANSSTNQQARALQRLFVMQLIMNYEEGR